MGGWMKNAVASAAVATSIATTVAAGAANDMFLKIDGIKGESADHKHKGEIDVVAWSWGIAAPATHSASPTGQNTGRLVIHDISITKKLDLSSPLLLQHATNGRYIKEVTLVVRKSGEKGGEFLKIKLSNVRVAQVKNHGVGPGEGIMEEVTLNFEKVEYEYRPQAADGSLGPPVNFGWDIKANLKI
jgi:type VI secretion system secreted protein Hcp